MFKGDPPPTGKWSRCAVLSSWSPSWAELGDGQTACLSSAAKPSKSEGGTGSASSGPLGLPKGPRTLGPEKSHQPRGWPLRGLAALPHASAVARLEYPKQGSHRAQVSSHTKTCTFWLVQSRQPAALAFSSQPLWSTTQGQTATVAVQGTPATSLLGAGSALKGPGQLGQPRATTSCCTKRVALPLSTGEAGRTRVCPGALGPTHRPTQWTFCAVLPAPSPYSVAGKTGYIVPNH